MPDIGNGRQVKLARDRQKMMLSPRQFFIGLHREGLISEAEALALAKDRTLPAVAEAYVSTMGQPEQTEARIVVSSMTEVTRTDWLVEVLAGEIGLTPEEVDAFFAAYRTI